MKKTMKRHSFKSGLLSLIALCSMALIIGSCANDDVAQNPTIPNDDKNLTTFAVGAPTTRTSMESDGKFFWEQGDKIYVKDDNNTWHASSNSPTSKTDNFKFKVPGTYIAHTSYEVYYPGQGGYYDQAKISAYQSQAEPNTTTHFGASGDCGIAKATRNATSHEFEFALDHKAAYLLFLPHTSNNILNKCYLTRVEVNSDDDITDTYTLDPATGKLTGTGTGKQITLWIKGSGTYANGFPLTNSTASAATNGAYMVIKPGTHTLKIRYWVKDIVTRVEGTITKILSSKNFEQNKYYNITANLDVRDYDGDHYYMWDAKEQYWKGHEWNKGGSQPTLNYSLSGATTSNDYAQNNGDSRWCNEASGFGRFDATQSCATLPNANEMIWYATKGDPRWDGDEVWTALGHLYKGGMWIKKKAYISGYNKNTTPSGIDGRTTFNLNQGYPSYTLPDAADANKYFYLPALGYYNFAKLCDIGKGGSYWSSSADPNNNTGACYLSFDKDGIELRYNYERHAFGFRVEPSFE